MFNIVDQTKTGAVIKVIGAGGAGRNAVEYMLKQGIVGAGFVCANTMLKR
ncbi:MAG: hypothetical protein K0U66_06715 [Gammaproteobacteria bacterium]|nr:hypothetical protein [Gammaproteobacteria bacterium]